MRLPVEACGYVSDTNCVLRDVDEPMKIKLLWGHNEIVAVLEEEEDFFFFHFYPVRTGHVMHHMRNNN